MSVISASVNTQAIHGGCSERHISAHQTVASRVIETNHHVLQSAPRDGLNQEVAVRFVAIDVSAIRNIADKTERFFAAVCVGDNAHHHARYRAELQLLAPEIAEEARAAFQESEQRVWGKEDRKAAELDQLRYRTVATVHDPRTDADRNKESVYLHEDQTRRQAALSARTWARQGYWGSVYCQRTGECVEDFAPTSDDDPVEDVQLFNPIENAAAYLPEVGTPLLREAADIEVSKMALSTAQAEVKRCELAISTARGALLKRIAKEYVLSEVEAADAMCTRSRYAVIQGADNN
jgi:hypothetical protein